MWKRILVGLLITAIVLWIYIKVTHVNIGVMLKLPPEVLLASAALMVLSDMLRAIRLKVLSEYVKAGLSLKESIVIWEASRLLALLTPGFYGGEFVRIGFIAKKYNLSKALAINILEITSEVIGIGINASVAFLILFITHMAKVNVEALYFPFLISLIMVTIMSTIPAIKRCPKRFGERFHKMCTSVVKAISIAGYEALGNAVLLSTMAVAVYSMSFGVISSSVNHEGVVGTLVFACSLPVTAIPVTPGGVGLPEAVATLALPSLATSLVIWRIVNITVVTTLSTLTTVVGGLTNIDFKNLLSSEAPSP